MNEVTSPTSTVVMRDHVQIRMRDGTLLSARIWLPSDAEQHPVPVLLEYLPYRKGDWTAPRDAQRHPWYAAHGYASVRVDMRGSGDSEGVMLDEYAPIEQQDALDVIDWLAEQSWSTGNVGMFGISWGGFNSLQVAALRPKPLKAIVTVCSTDDRYADDVHYFGGAVLAIDMVAWATTMLAFTARPPDPSRVGPPWRDLWQQRLDALEPFLDTWMSHQERDEYWQHGSVCQDYSAIEAAVLAVGGWADPYRNTVFRLVENLSSPVKGIIGPWPHQYPDIARPPGPAIGFLQETLRWWDHWLKGKDTGVTGDPALRVWMQDSVRPATAYITRPGHWVTEPSFPSPNIEDRFYPLADMVARAYDGIDKVLVDTPQHTGIDAGRYFPFGNSSDLPPDQREEDGRSVCFDTAPLTGPVEVLGLPAVQLRVTATSAANVIVRLCDVAPDGSSTLVTRGCLNLLKRDGMDQVAPVIAGEALDLSVPMVGIAWTFPPGHRIRVGVSTSYWPWIWPHPLNSQVVVNIVGSQLCLPLRHPEAASEPVSFEPPEQAPPMPVEFHVTGREPEREVRYLPQSGQWQLIVDPNYGGRRTYPDGLVFDEKVAETYTIKADDPLSAEAASRWKVRLRRPDWDVQIEATGRMTADHNHFFTEHELVARLNGESVAERRWTRTIPRTSG